jgi:hypothetical protein
MANTSKATSSSVLLNRLLSQVDTALHRAAPLKFIDTVVRCVAAGITIATVILMFTVLVALGNDDLTSIGVIGTALTSLLALLFVRQNVFIVVGCLLAVAISAPVALAASFAGIESTLAALIAFNQGVVPVLAASFGVYLAFQLNLFIIQKVRLAFSPIEKVEDDNNDDSQSNSHAF